MISAEELDRRLTGYTFEPRVGQDNAGADVRVREYKCGCYAEQNDDGTWNLWACDKATHQRSSP